jgi:arginine utilization regulatory protein
MEKPVNHIKDMELVLGDVDYLKVFAELPQGVIIADAKGRVVFRNKAQASIDDLGSEETLGKPVTEVYHLTDKNSMIMRCLSTGQPITGQVFYYRLSRGPLKKVIHSVYPLFSKQGLKGAICFVWDEELLQKQIANSKALIRENDRDLGNNTRFTFADIVGADPLFLGAVNRARKVAGTDSPVLIWGETGTGKELVAQAIHNHSPKRSGPFVAINCAALPESLQESILFGTVKGAFTGAVDKPGVFEEAQKGTLYLDELDSMPEMLQAKLLRVLQEKKVRRLGSSREVNVDVKVLSSLSRNPRLAVQEGTLRQDLFYRLGVVIVHLTPLRERHGDISILAWHFVAKLNCRLGTEIESISDEAMALLQGFSWPGNVRQLENTLESAMNEVGNETILDVRHLEQGLFSSEQGEDNDLGQREAQLLEFVSSHHPRPDHEMTLQEYRAMQEVEMIRHALEETRGQMTQAARKLGISRQLLYYKAKKMGLDPKSFR